MVAMAELLSVNVVHALVEGRWAPSAIDKRPVAGPVEVATLGLAGDRQMQSCHGGPDKAVYAYAAEDAAGWAERLGYDVRPGWFGENLTTRGLDVTGALLGEQWVVGPVALEVRMPRTPCENLSKRVGVDRFHIEFQRSGRVGAMLRVLTPGVLEPGMAVRVHRRPDHPVSVGDWARGASREQAEALLDSGIGLAASVRAKARRLARACVG